MDVDLEPVIAAIQADAEAHNLKVDEPFRFRFAYHLREQPEAETLWKVEHKLETVARSEGGAVPIDDVLQLESVY